MIIRIRYAFFCYMYYTLTLRYSNTGEQAKLAFPITGFLTTCPSIEGKGCFKIHHLKFFNN